MGRIALYCRVSTDLQVKEHTIESQLEALRAYAQNKGYHVVALVSLLRKKSHSYPISIPSSVPPSATNSLTHVGCLPFPVHVCFELFGFLYFAGALFFLFSVSTILRNASTDTPHRVAISCASCKNRSLSSSLRRVASASISSANCFNSSYESTCKLIFS